MLKNVCLPITFLLLLNDFDFASKPYHTPRRIEATFSFEIMIDHNNFEVEKDLQYWLPLPTCWDNQRIVEIITTNPKPNKIDVNSKKDLKVWCWDFSKLDESKTYSITIDLRVDLYKVDYFLDPDIVLDNYDQDQQIVTEYTRSDSLAFITQEIIELANELNRNVSDPFLKTRNIYRWVLLHMEPQFPVLKRGTRYLFSHPIDSRRNIYGGDSAEYSWVFIALCRAAGVPARPAVGFLVKPGWEVPHTWAEFYLPKWGWLPADPYLADSKELLHEFSNQHDDYYYLGHLDNYHLAFYKGSDFQLQPRCPFSHKPFIFNNSIWYAPIGIWNFDKFSNASANLMVKFHGLITNKYKNPEYGIELDLFDTWFQQLAAELGPYILKERFLNEDKSIKLDFVGRELPSSHQNIDSREAAKLEINGLKKLNRTYQIVSEGPIKIGNSSGYNFVANFEDQGKLIKEYRVYIVKKNYLFWLIYTTDEELFDKYREKIQNIAQNVKLNLPERRLK